MSDEMRLSDAEITAIARAVVAELRRGPLPKEQPAMISAEEVARRLGVSAAWVRENADGLGVIRLGSGPKAPLRFDPEDVRAALTSFSASSRSELGNPRLGAGSPRAGNGERAEGAGLLPIFELNSPESEKKAGGRRANDPAQATRKRPSTRPKGTRRAGTSVDAAGRSPAAANQGGPNGS